MSAKSSLSDATIRETREAFETALCSVIDYYNKIIADLRADVTTLSAENARVKDRCKVLSEAARTPQLTREHA